MVSSKHCSIIMAMPVMTSLRWESNFHLRLAPYFPNPCTPDARLHLKKIGVFPPGA